MQKKRFTFTGKKLAELAAPHSGRDCYYDATVHGVQLEVTASGVKSFRVYRKFKGRPVKITLGHFDAELPETRELPSGAAPLDLLGNHPSLNVRMARKLAVAVMAELDTGVNPAESHARKGMTLGEVFDRYRAQLVAEGRKGVPGVVWYYERYLGALPAGPKKKHGQERSKAPGGVNWHHRALAEIQHADVSRLRLDLAEKVGRTTANRVMELLRAIFNFAKRHRLFTGENPAAGTGKFKIASRERFLQADELAKFFTALDTELDLDFRDYVKLSIFTGARRGNVLRMRWDELNLDGARWTVAGEVMKNGEPLTIPLVQEAVNILRDRADNLERERDEASEPSPWVFPGNTPAGHAGPFRAQWGRLTAAAGVPDLRIHDLRRSLGSWMASSGASTVLTMRALGHKSITAALIYQRLAADPVREAMQRAVTAMAEAAKPKKGQLKQMPKSKRAKAGK
jgi:integrase